jgi:hypothetical protein
MSIRWKVNQKQPEPDVVEISDESGIVLIAQVFGAKRDERAKLIAAAPEMADMLLSMYVHVSHGGPTLAEAEALLKKAGVLPESQPFVEHNCCDHRAAIGGTGAACPDCGVKPVCINCFNDHLPETCPEGGAA